MSKKNKIPIIRPMESYLEMTDSPVALVLVAKHGIVEKKFDEVERDFLSAMRQAGLL